MFDGPADKFEYVLKALPLRHQFQCLLFRIVKRFNSLGLRHIPYETKMAGNSLPCSILLDQHHLFVEDASVFFDPAQFRLCFPDLEHPGECRQNGWSVIRMNRDLPGLTD